MYKTLVAVVVVSSLLGCATLLRNPNQKLNILSDPESAKVYANGQYLGETPVQYKLDARKTYILEFKKEGYKTKTYSLGNFVGGGWVVLDIFVGGLIGIIVDAATGSWYYLVEDNVSVPLEKE